MLKVIGIRLLQHLIAQNNWANQQLTAFAGKSVKFQIGPIYTTLVILEHGGLAIAGETNDADAMVSISPSLLMRLLAKDEAAKLLIQIKGDTHLATALAKVFASMRWDYEDDLSQWVGDVPALKIGQLSRHAVESIKDTSRNLADMLSEYLQEEAALLAKKRHVESFNAEVDILRDDVARLEKKIAKLSQLRIQQGKIA